jgi:hypothetical protein
LPRARTSLAVVVLLGIPHLVDARIHHETTHDAIVHSGRPTRSHDTTALL